MLIKPKPKAEPKKRPCLQVFDSTSAPEEERGKHWLPVVGGSSLFHQIAPIVDDFSEDHEKEPPDDDRPTNEKIIVDRGGVRSGLMTHQKEVAEAPPPRYIHQLVEVAKLRQAEMETIHERQMMREILDQGSPIDEAFVTPGYRKRLAERAIAAKTLAQREATNTVQSLKDLHRKTIFSELARQQSDHQPQESLQDIDDSLTETMIGKTPSEMPTQPNRRLSVNREDSSSSEDDEKKDREAIIISAKARYQQRKQQHGATTG